eukprot:7445960-Pyramimonas_sp.AAC.1
MRAWIAEWRKHNKKQKTQCSLERKRWRLQADGKQSEFRVEAGRSKTEEKQTERDTGKNGWKKGRGRGNKQDRGIYNV